MKKILQLLIALLVLFSLALAPFHHHDEGQSHTDCALCRLSQDVLGFFLLLFFVFLFSPVRPRAFAPAAVKDYQSLYLSSKLRGRAPPFLF